MKPLLTILSTAAVTGAVAFGGYQAVSLLNAPERWEYVAPEASETPAAAEAMAGRPETSPETPEIREPEKTDLEMIQEPEAVVEPEPAPVPALAATLLGTYRCWSFNAGGAGSRCTSPPMVFSANGTYSMSSERGTYTLNGSSVTLSKSTIRGVGALSADQTTITFHYFSNGVEYTVTYLKQ